jgi:hypothetical protein
MKQILENWSYYFKVVGYGFQKDKKIFLEHYNNASHPCFSIKLPLLFILSEKQRIRYLNELYTMREIAERKEMGKSYKELNEKFLKGWTMTFPTGRDLALLPSHID